MQMSRGPTAPANPDQEQTLSSLRELNQSLRQQVVELALSIAVLRENDPALAATAAQRPSPVGQTLRSPTLAQNIGLFGV
jgi:hypothetical protein